MSFAPLRQSGVEFLLSLTMCRAKAVGTAVAEQAGAETDTLLPYVGVVAPPESSSSF